MRKLNLEELESGFPVLDDENQKGITGGISVYEILDAINRGETSFDGCRFIFDNGICTSVQYEGNYIEMGSLSLKSEIGGSDSGGDPIAFAYGGPEITVYPSDPYRSDESNVFTDTWDKFLHDPLTGLDINGGFPVISTATGLLTDMQGALAYIQSVVDQHIPYRQETSYALRTAGTAEALAYMDCSELVCRYFAAMGFISTKVLAMNSLAIRQYSENHPDMLMRLTNDTPPQTGDIFLWHRSDTDGHTGIVKSYDANTGMVTILEEYSYGDIHEAREIEYGIDSYALSRHQGWEGFYRPNVN